MRRLTSADHGKLVEFDHGLKKRQRGKICFEGNTFYLCQNAVSGDVCKNRLGYAFSYHVGENFLMSPLGFGRVRILDDAFVLFKKTGSGILFRRVYRQDDELVFVGTIQKDIEDCKKPSASVSVMDPEYLEQSGWKPYVKEPSAEEKLKEQSIQGV
jgi:hypothetical protein